MLHIAGKLTLQDEGVVRGALLSHFGADATSLVCDVSDLLDPDASTLDVLARLQLSAARLGGRILLRGTPKQLGELLLLAGLDEILPTEAPSGV